MKKALNIIIIILFGAYWLIVGFITFGNSSQANRIKNTTWGQTLFPPTYKMYTSPPKQIIQTKYYFFKNGKKIDSIDVDEWYAKKLKADFPYPILKKDLKNYLKIYYLPGVNMGNEVYKYALDSMTQKEKSMQDYLLSNKQTMQEVENQLNVVPIFGMQKADSVNIVITRTFNAVGFDTWKDKKLAYWITDSVLIEKGKKLKNAQQ